MILSIFVFLLVLPFIGTQYSSKCNIPILQSWLLNGNFLDYRFPIDYTSVINKYGNLLTPFDSLNFPFWKDFGSIWKITKMRDFIEIQFSNPIQISSFAITVCTEYRGKCIQNNPNTNSTFTFDYKSKSNGAYNRLKPVHFPNGKVLLENRLDGLPTLVSFKQIQTESILVTKRYSVSDTTNLNYFVQFEIFGCSGLPENIVSLNPNILHYDVIPGFTLSPTNTLIHGWCTKYGCNGLTDILIDGNILFDSSQSQNSEDLIKWNSLGTDGQNIFLNIFLNGDYTLNYLVIHSIFDGNGRIWTPEIFINDTRHTEMGNKISSGTSHTIVELNGGTYNKIFLEFRVNHDVSLVLSEIELFGLQEISQNNKNTFEIGDVNISIFISSIYFTITLGLIIPLLIAVVVICFRIKRKTVYFPVPQNTKQSNYSSSNLFSSKEILRTNDQSNSNSRVTSYDTNQENTPMAGDTIKRLDTNVLYNMYERIPTLTTIKGGKLRESLRKTSKKNETKFSQETSFPIYSVPSNNNRPASHDGYLELRNLSVDDHAPILATPQEDDPFYDYVRPRSAMIQYQESNESTNHPNPQYLNTKEIPKYVNTNNINTAL